MSIRLTAAYALAVATAMPLFAQSASPIPVATSDSVAQTWGVLAEMAGRDFEGKDFFVTARWIEPKKHLQLDRWSGDWSGNFKYRYEFELDPATGRIGLYTEGRKGKDDSYIKADRDGSIAVSDRTGKYEPWLTRGEDSAIIWGKKKIAPLDPAGKHGQRLAKLIAQGRIVPSGTGLAAAVVAPMSAAATQSAERARPAAAGQPFLASTAAAAEVAQSKAKWGALAVIVGKSWYCVGSNPEQWIARKRIESGYGFSYNRSPPVIRLTTAEWLVPYKSMKVTTLLGDARRWVDTIDLQRDGSFLMVTEGVRAFARVRGYSDGWTVTFPLGKYDTNQNMLTFGGYASSPEYLLSSGTFGDDARCFMEIIDTPESAERFKKEFLDARKAFDEKSSQIPSIQADMANDRARGEQMRANMQASLIGAIAGGGGNGPVAYFPNTSSISGVSGSSFYEQLTAMADQAHREAKQSKQQLDRTIATGLARQSAASSNGGAIIIENLPPAPTYTPSPSPSPPSTVAQSAPPPTYTNPTPTDTCKRRVPYNYGVYKDLPYKEGTRCLDAAKVSGQ